MTDAPEKPIFLLMPAWQGAASSRAMLLVDGAEHLRDDLPRSATVEVSVPAHAGDSLGTPISRLSSVLAARDSALEALADHGNAPSITLGCDCSGALAGLEHAASRHPGLAVLWIDAHPDLQDPSTSPTGSAARMALLHAIGRGHAELASRHPVDPACVLLVGTRDMDGEEGDAVNELALESRDASGVDEWVADAVAKGATHLYVHVDLDVLDPASFASVHQALPFGLGTGELTAAIKQAVGRLPLAGATIAGFAPPDEHVADDDAPTVLRIIAALTSGLKGRNE